jgi:hypothetical protein
MEKMTPEEEEKRKKYVFDSMSARRQKHILEKIGYDQWDPFQEPKDPIDIRKDKTKRTSHQLMREFLRSRSFDEYSNAYGQGVFEICMGLINDDDRYLAMYEFSCWYQDLLKKELEP